MYSIKEALLVHVFLGRTKNVHMEFYFRIKSKAPGVLLSSMLFVVWKLKLTLEVYMLHKSFKEETKQNDENCMVLGKNKSPEQLYFALL